MYNAIHFYRAARWLYLHKIPFIPKLIELLIFLIYNSKIPYQAEIGAGTKFGYGGIGVVVHKNCRIGRNVMIAQQVTLGGGNRHYPGVPTVGDGVYIAKGATILGGITIGDNVTIGSNAVVTRPVPSNAIAAGIPAKVLRIKDEDEINQK